MLTYAFWQVVYIWEVGAIYRVEIGRAILIAGRYARQCFLLAFRFPLEGNNRTFFLDLQDIPFKGDVSLWAGVLTGSTGQCQTPQ